MALLGKLDHARSVIQDGLALDPAFTIRRLRLAAACQLVVGDPSQHVRRQCRPFLKLSWRRKRCSAGARADTQGQHRVEKIAAISCDRPITCPTFGSSAKAHSAPAPRFSAMMPLRDSRSCSPTNKSPGTRRAGSGAHCHHRQETASPTKPRYSPSSTGKNIASPAPYCGRKSECHSACNIDPLSRGIGFQN